MKRFFLQIRRLVLILALVAGGHAVHIWVTNNFSTVVHGEVYRSAQPGPRDLVSYHAQYGVRTVINLRGEADRAGWYKAEKETSEKLGLHHIDFKMSSSKLLSPEDARKLIAIMRTAEKPLLIHCRAGADRTGLASALYLADIAKSGEVRAERQLSIRYGHFAVPYLSEAYPMDESFEAMEGLLGFADS